MEEREKIQNAYDQGLRDGSYDALEMFAWWKDGEQYMGQQRPDGTGTITLKDAYRCYLESKTGFLKRGEFRFAEQEPVEVPFGNCPKTTVVIKPDAYVFVDDGTVVRFDILVGAYNRIKADVAAEVLDNLEK